MNNEGFDGCVARFVGHEHWLLRRADGSYKLNELAFEPKLNNVTNRMEVSVWAHKRGGRMSMPWVEGENYVKHWRFKKGKPEPRLKGIGDLEVSAISQVKLEVEDPKCIPLPAHVNIISWEQHQETEWKALSKTLADRSVFYEVASNISDPNKIRPEFTPVACRS